MIKATATFVLSIIVLTGCISTDHTGIEVISPLSTAENSMEYGLEIVPAKIDSLQPILNWLEPAGQAGTYDVAVFEAYREDKVSGQLQGNFWKPGEKVYFREGITGCTHQVEEALKPNRMHFWTVRKKCDGEVSEWATYSVRRIAPLGWIKFTGEYYMFKTPPQ